MNKEIIKTLTSKKITVKNFFFIVFTSIKPANSDVLHINMVNSIVIIFLPYHEKESQLLWKILIPHENLVYVLINTQGSLFVGGGA
jgi:hypothetical protein